VEYICRRCVYKESERQKILNEIAHCRDRSIQNLVSQTRYGMLGLRARTKQYAKERSGKQAKEQAEYREKLKQYEEELSYQVMEKILEGEEVNRLVDMITKDKVRERLQRRVRELMSQTQELTEQDLLDLLQDHIEQGDIDLHGETIKITPRGARKLARNVLARVLEKLDSKEIGPHQVEESGYGVEFSTSSRKYELGDEYNRIDFEATLLNALGRNAGQKEISLETEDFQVHEGVHQTKILAGLLIDESSSMTGDKTGAAIDTALALAELITREPKDLLKVYLFSDRVRKIQPYDILNTRFAGGSTDIRAAMRAFRRGTANEKGDKQAYLVTDTEPNTQDSHYLGFERAIVGVVQEALAYRQAGITLNIIMLDETPRLKELASILAKRNLGRVFYTSPQRLGELVIEDYITSKKKAYKRG